MKGTIRSKQNSRKLQSQLELLMEFFQKNPNRDISHPEVVDWATKEYTKRTDKVFRDPDRGIRQLHEKGYLIKIKKGVYHYNPNAIKKRNLQDFSIKLKETILKRDEYKCVICGQGKQEGMELHVDHIKARALGGKAKIENGQTLCSKHNFIKKRLAQTETGKKMFIRLYDLSKKEDHKELKNFCLDILKIYEDHGINGHIIWKK